MFYSQSQYNNVYTRVHTLTNRPTGLGWTVLILILILRENTTNQHGLQMFYYKAEHNTTHVFTGDFQRS